MIKKSSVTNEKTFFAVLKRFRAKRKNGFEKNEKVIFLLKNGHLFLSFFKNFSRLFTFLNTLFEN